MSMAEPATPAVTVYTRPSPKKYNASEYGRRIIVFRKMYPAVFSLPIRTGSIGILTFAYSSLDFMARHQKCGGVHMNTNQPTRKPVTSIEPVVEAHPAIEAALPANPPITMFKALLRLSQIV